MTKSRWSTLIPYRAQRGTIRFVPTSSAVPGVPSLKVKAKGANRMLVLNTADYAGKDFIKFDNRPIDAGEKKLKEIGAGAMMEVKGSTMTYKCTLSKK